MSRPLAIGLVDTGVNGWHSHVRGRVDGCALRVVEERKVERPRYVSLTELRRGTHINHPKPTPHELCRAHRGNGEVSHRP